MTKHNLNLYPKKKQNQEAQTLTGYKAAAIKPQWSQKQLKRDVNITVNQDQPQKFLINGPNHKILEAVLDLKWESLLQQKSEKELSSTQSLEAASEKIKVKVGKNKDTPKINLTETTRSQTKKPSETDEVSQSVDLPQINSEAQQSEMAWNNSSCRNSTQTSEMK